MEAEAAALSGDALPGDVLEALAGAETVLVTSRDPGVSGTVPMGFAVVPPGVLHLLTSTMSVKARRWASDPWVRVIEPASGATVEGRVRVVTAAEVAAIAEALSDRFAMSGAATPEALVRLLSAGTHVLLRVEPAAR